MLELPPRQIQKNMTDQINELPAQPLIEHLQELKKRMVYSLLAFFAASAFSYYFAEDIYAFLVRPLADAFPDPSNRADQEQGGRRHQVWHKGMAFFFI